MQFVERKAFEPFFVQVGNEVVITVSMREIGRRRNRPEAVAPADLGADWLGGFFCPCHQSKYDLAGRVYKSMPAPLNLVVPPHRYATDTLVVIGEDPKA